METNKQSRSLRQLAMMLFGALLFSNVLCLWRSVLASELETKERSSHIGSHDPSDVPLAEVSNLRRCHTPTPQVYLKDTEVAKCAQAFSMSDLLGEGVEKLEVGASVEVSCMRDKQTLQIDIRNPDELKTVTREFPPTCECGLGDSTSAAFTADQGFSGQIDKLLVMSHSKVTRNIHYQRTNCPLPALYIMDPYSVHLEIHEGEFQPVRKCMWKIDLKGNVTPFVSATANQIRVFYKDDEEWNPMEKPEQHKLDEAQTFTLDLPGECVMSDIEGEILAWTHPVQEREWVRVQRPPYFEARQHTTHTQIFININPKPADNVFKYFNFKNPMDYVMNLRRPNPRNQKPQPTSNN